MREKICGIYCIRNMVNGKRIVGSSTNIHGRFAQHKNDLKYNKHRNPYLQNAWNKYSKDSFSFEIIETCDESKLIEREDFHIILLNTLDRNYGYNFNLASRHTQNEESKEKIRQSRLGKKMSEEQKKKLSEAHTGKKIGHYSEERRKHISEALKGNQNCLGRIVSEITREKISSSQKGKIITEEMKKHMSEAHKGSKHHLWGKHHSKETKQKIRASNIETYRKIAELKKLNAP